MDACVYIHRRNFGAGPSPGQKMWGGHTWRACGARAYNGGLRAEPPAWSRGRALAWSWWQGRGQRRARQAPNHDRLPNPILPSKNSPDFASISGTTSGKSGVDMSTPVDPVATPLFWGVRTPTFWSGDGSPTLGVYQVGNFAFKTSSADMQSRPTNCNVICLNVKHQIGLN